MTRMATALDDDNHLGCVSNMLLTRAEPPFPPLSVFVSFALSSSFLLRLGTASDARWDVQIRN